VLPELEPVVAEIIGSAATDAFVIPTRNQSRHPVPVARPPGFGPVSFRRHDSPKG
jgi:hypothetical protein